VALTSGTSAGKGANNFDYDSFDQMSIFQKVSELGMDWKDYLVDTSIQDARWYKWTYASNMTDNIVYMDSFYADAAAGTLPQFAYINPSCCDVGTNSMHPTGKISDGEQLIKDVYEALRASPQWEEILWVLTFDETGGFHDHVKPPQANRPDDLTYTELTPAGENYTFEFDRLGGRLPTWLVSPWVAAAVEQQGVNSDGATKSYHATSILRTLGYLWDFEPFTPRVEKAPSFDHLIQTTFRDCPMTMPQVVNFTSY
jgi:phospholipase C